MARFSILTAACIVAVQSGLACGNDDSNTPMAAGAGGNEAAAGGSTAIGGGGTTGSSDFLTKASGLNDSETLNVIEVASAGQIQRAGIAENKAQNPAVRAFASKIAEDYTIVDYSAAVTANTMGAAPSTSEAASMVTRADDAFTQGMTAMPGSADFDRRYMDVQLEADKGMLAMVERMLTRAEGIPLRTLLTETLEASQRHVDEATLIRFTLK